jgi:photosystem II stability/assembly factor-like uncharacterized protein
VRRGGRGYALDMSGGLFKTANGGNTWQTLDTGTAAAPPALAAPRPDVVVVVGPRGIRRGEGAAQPDPVGGATVSRADLDSVVSRPGLLVAYGQYGTRIFLSTDDGETWKAVKLPKKIYIGAAHGADFVTTNVGWFIDSDYRLWKTANAGRSWSQMTATGTSDARTIAMADSDNGFIPLQKFAQSPAGPTATAYVLRTSDGGKTWRPQAIARGPLTDAIASGPFQGYALVGGNHMFFTNSGGDAGSPTTLALKTPVKVFTPKAFKKARGRVAVSGTLPGAVGGEQIVVSRRDVTGSGWAHQVVTAGANGGSFTTSWRIRRSAIFVAQWAGDSGRRGAGSSPLTITVKVKPKPKKKAK